MATKNKFRGVSWKFLAILMPTVTLTATIAIAFYMYSRLATTEEVLLQKVEVISDVHSMAVAYPLWTLDRDGIERSIQTLALYPEITCVEVFESSALQTYRSPENCSSIGEGEQFYTTELLFENQTVGQLNIAYTIDPLTSVLKREIFFSALFSLLLVSVVSTVAYAAMHLIVARPLRKLITSIKQSVDQERRIPVEWSSSDELGSVMAAYNNMIQQVEDNTNELVSAREQAESAANTKSRFLANMSHELRTPLNAVIGITEMLREEAEDGELDTEPYERIAGSGRHLLNLIDDILDFSKLEAGKVDITREEVNLFELIEDVTATARLLADERNNDLIQVFNGQPEYLNTDPLRLSQIILNLLSNACKFTKNGQIHLTVKVTGDSHNKGVLFSVRDTGIGISHERREHLFKDFSQADSSTTRQYGGTGLGLAISQKLCGLLGGEIRLQSNPGEGSEFSFILPL